MYKSILVPIDLSHPGIGEKIIKRAIALADEGAKLTLLNVIGDVPSYAQSYLPEGQMQANLEEVGEVLTELANSNNVKADIVVRYGSASPVILDEAQDREVDLIIIGSHHPGIKDYLIGSTASRVTRHADCSVLVER